MLTTIVLNCNGMTVIYKPAQQLLPMHMHTQFKNLKLTIHLAFVNIRKTTNLAYFIWH